MKLLWNRICTAIHKKQMTSSESSVGRLDSTRAFLIAGSNPDHFFSGF